MILNAIKALLWRAFLFHVKHHAVKENEMFHVKQLKSGVYRY